MELHDTRILIADENPHQRALLREALNRGGYRYIDEAGGGEDALNKIDRTHPDVPSSISGSPSWTASGSSAPAAIWIFGRISPRYSS